VYDFTASAEDEAMVNQLACFSLLNKKWKDPFEGTIIRIPLRNAAQAVRSEISKTETTKMDVQDAIDSFAKDMGSNGLLFLKSVRHIVLSVNGEQVNEVEITNRHDLAG
jgi:sacsin